MATFSLGKHPHVELCDLLKLEGWSESGAQAKIAIAEGQVKVDGAVETRKRCNHHANRYYARRRSPMHWFRVGFESHPSASVICRNHPGDAARRRRIVV